MPSVTKSPSPPPPAIIRCGELDYQPASDRFRLAGQPLLLSTCETRILAALITAPNTTVDRQGIVDAVPSRSFTSCMALVRRLRRKIGHDRIETVRGGGYRLTVS